MPMFPIVEVSGGAFERGRMHGKQARIRVGRSLANYARLFAFHGMPWEEAQRRSAGYRDLIGGFDAGLLEEMQGIARGAGRPFSEILALNVRTEVLPPSFLAGADAGECTAIAVRPAASATGETLLAQNWDWLGSQREALVLLRLLRDESAGLLSICRRPDPSLPPEAQIESVASVIMELSRGVMHVAPDVPSRAEYQAVSLEGEAVLQ